MSEPTLKKTYELLEKLASYVMNEVPTRHEMEKRFEHVNTEMDKRFQAMSVEMDRRFQQVDTEMDKRFEQANAEMDKRFQQANAEMNRRFLAVERELARKADKEDLEIVKKNIQTIIDGMDTMVGTLDDMRTEQKAFIAGLERLESRVSVLEKKFA